MAGNSTDEALVRNTLLGLKPLAWVGIKNNTTELKTKRPRTQFLREAMLFFSRTINWFAKLHLILKTNAWYASAQVNWHDMHIIVLCFILVSSCSKIGCKKRAQVHTELVGSRILFYSWLPINDLVQYATNGNNVLSSSRVFYCACRRCKCISWRALAL